MKSVEYYSRNINFSFKTFRNINRKLLIQPNTLRVNLVIRKYFIKLLLKKNKQKLC